VSADGRFLAFAQATNGLLQDVLRLDRWTGATSRVSVGLGGGGANGPSSLPSISADGRVIAFGSSATDLVPGDTNGLFDIFAAATAGFSGGAFVSSGDLDGLGQAAIITGPGAGHEPTVRMFEADGYFRPPSFLAYDPAFRGGVRLAACDFDGDLRVEILTGAGPGGGPHVKLVKLDSGGAVVGNLASFFAYDPAFRGGVFVACGDVDGDSVPEIVLGADAGGGPHVRVLKLQSGAPGGVVPLLDFFAYSPAFLGGVRVAAGDVDGSGRASIIAGPGPGGGPHVRVVKWTGSGLTDLANFFAYPPAFTGGVFVAAGDLTGDGQAEIVSGADAGGGRTSARSPGPAPTRESAFSPIRWASWAGSGSRWATSTVPVWLRS
jgi:hypothetical protein